MAAIGKVKTNRELQGVLARLLYEKNGDEVLGDIARLFGELGEAEGQKLKQRMPTTDFRSCVEQVFGPAAQKEPPEAELLEVTDQGVAIKGFYCPLALEGAGRKLCEAAMEFDRSLISTITGKELGLLVEKTLAEGDAYCVGKFYVK